MTRERAFSVFGVVLLAGVAWWAGTTIGERLGAPEKEKRYELQKKTTETFANKNETIAIGLKCPDVTLQTLDGEWKSLAHFIRDTTLLLVIEPGCEACETELGELRDILDSEELASKIIILSDAYPLDLVQVKRAWGIKSPILIDRDRELLQQINGLVFPLNVVVDSDMTILSIKVSNLSKEEILVLLH